ncbi:MAG: hypothetical protein HZA54_16815 [Planctomycetes bacterium]|nr:hypothetical protein [Planctomycetota bacterium]
MAISARGCPRRARRPAALALALALTAVCGLRAGIGDVLHLTNGGRIEGKIVEEKDGLIRIQVKTGTTVVRASEVARIERKAAPEEEVAGRRAKLATGDVEGRVALAGEAARAGLETAAIELYREALGLASGHAAALAGLRRLIDPRVAERLAALAAGGGGRGGAGAQGGADTPPPRPSPAAAGEGEGAGAGGADGTGGAFASGVAARAAAAAALLGDNPESTWVPAVRAVRAAALLADGRPADAEREWGGALGADGRGLDAWPARAAAARRGIEQALAEQGAWSEAAARAEAAGARGAGAAESGADAGAAGRARAYRRLLELESAAAGGGASGTPGPGDPAEPAGASGAAAAAGSGLVERLRLLREVGLAARAVAAWRVAPAVLRELPEVLAEASLAAEAAGDAVLALELVRRAVALAEVGAAPRPAEWVARRARLELVARLGGDFPLEACGGSAGVARLEAAVARYFGAADAAGERAAVAEIEACRAPFAALEAVVRRPPPLPSLSADGQFAAVRGGGLLRRVPIVCPATGGPTTYMLWVPPGYDPARAWPLLLSFHPTHGTGEFQLATWQGTRSGKEFLLVCPTAERRIGFGHSRPSHSLVMAVLADVSRRCHVDPNRVFLEGMSMGAHLCWILGVTQPDRWAGIMPRSGSPLRVMEQIENLFAVPIYSLNGALDPQVPPDAPRTGCARLRELGYDVTYREFPGRGHDYFGEANPDLLAWMKARRREPYPRKVVYETREELYSRSFWLELGGIASARQTTLHVTGSDGEAIEDRVLMNTPGRATGEVRGQEVRLAVSPNVARVTVYLSGRMVDLDQPVSILRDGSVVWRGKVERSAAHLLEFAKRTGDREMLFAQRVTVGR